MTMSLNLISTVLLCLFTSESVSLVAGANLVYGSNDSFINCNDYRDSGSWYHNGTDTNVTGDRYFFSNVTFADAGQYECMLTNGPEVQMVYVFADLKPLFRTCDLRDGSPCERTVTQGQTVQVCVNYSTIPATLGSHEVIPLECHWTININGNEKFYNCNSSVCWTSQMNVLFRDANSTCFMIGNIQEDTICTFGANTPQNFVTRHSVLNAVVHLKVRGADSNTSDPSPSSAVVPTSSDIVSSTSSILIQLSTPTDSLTPQGLQPAIAGPIVAGALLFVFVIIAAMAIISVLVFFFKRRTCRSREIYAKVNIRSTLPSPGVISPTKSENDLENAPSKARPDKLSSHGFLTPHGMSKGTPTLTRPLISPDPTMSSGEGETPVVSNGRSIIREPPPDYSSLKIPVPSAQNVKSPEGLSIFMGSPSISVIDFEREEVLDSDFGGEPLGPAHSIEIRPK